MKNSFIRFILVLLVVFILMLLLSVCTIILTKAPNYSTKSIISSLCFICGFLITGISFIILTSPKKSKYKNFISLESAPIEFENVYKTLCAKHIPTLEKMRKQVKLRRSIQYVFFTFFIIGYFFGKSIYFLDSIPYLSTLNFISLIFAIIFWFTNISYQTNYKNFYKKEIISNFIKLINSELEYNPLASSVVESDYRIANFDNKVFNRFFPDDYIEGFIDDNTFIKMCDLHIQHHYGSGKNSQTDEVFQGLFAHTKTGTNLGTYVKVSKNDLKLIKHKDFIESDSEDFEKYFDIYSKNKIIALQLLTSDIMELLISFYNKYHIDFEIVFKDNSIFLRFFTGAMFEPKTFGNSMDKKLLFTYYTILFFSLDITKALNKALRELEI